VSPGSPLRQRLAELDQRAGRAMAGLDRRLVRRAAPLATPSRARWGLRGVGGLVVVGVASCLAVGANRPAHPHLLRPEARASLRGHSGPARVRGFSQVGFRVIRASVGGSGAPSRCALFADTPARRARGLMGRRDLAGYDAMIFHFDTDSNAGFYNRGVPMALSVAWFDSLGVFVGSADLAVCSRTCPTVAPLVAYRSALEVKRGGLARLGIGPGSVLVTGGNCASR